MKCPKCNAELEADVKFCGHCGARVQPKQSTTKSSADRCANREVSHVADSNATTVLDETPQKRSPRDIYSNFPKTADPNATTLLSDDAPQFAPKADPNVTTVLTDNAPQFAPKADPNATTVLSDDAPQFAPKADPNATTVLTDNAPQFAPKADPNATTVLSDDAPQFAPKADPNATTVLSDDAPQFAPKADPNATTVLSDSSHSAVKSRNVGYVPNAAAPQSKRQVTFASPVSPAAAPVPQMRTVSKDKKTVLIVGICVGVLMFLLAIAIILFLFLHRCEVCGDWFFGKAYDLFGYTVDGDCYRDFFGLNF